jgi:catechol 2,3-dioxygenase-like lactoylglutathione lyase family enzyme
MPELWMGRKTFEPTRGRVVDHLAFSVGNLSATLGRLRNDGVKISDESQSAAFIEGPDRISIELVEGLAHKE